MSIEKTFDAAAGGAARTGAANGQAARNGARVSVEWPIAARYRTSPLPLSEIIDAEFNAAQLRELARWLDVKLKGTSKLGFTEQVVEALNERISRMQTRLKRCWMA